MPIEKKSLFSNLKTAKKGLAASSSTAETPTSETRSNLRKSTRSAKISSPAIKRV